MNEAIAPNATAIADAMLKRTGEILQGQAAVPSARKSLADQVIETLKSIGAPSMVISGQRSLDAINALLKAAEAEQSKPVIDLQPAVHSVDGSSEGVERLSGARISELWNGMPGGHYGFCKEWGYYQFAQAVENEVRTSLLADHCKLAGTRIGEEDRGAAR